MTNQTQLLLHDQHTTTKLHPVSYQNDTIHVDLTRNIDKDNHTTKQHSSHKRKKHSKHHSKLYDDMYNHGYNISDSIKGNITQIKLTELLQFELHRITSLINEIISIIIEIIIYIGGGISLLASLFMPYYAINIDIAVWWLLTICLIIYIIGELLRLFRPFDEYDSWIRSMLPKWVNTYILGSRVTVALCTNELSSTGETALLYRPFYVSSSYVEHVSFGAAVLLSIIYALVAIKESNRPDEIEDIKDDLTDTTLDIKDHVVETTLDKLKRIVVQTGEEVIEAKTGEE